MENLYYQHFSGINFSDPFFNSLSNDYPDFFKWVENKKYDPQAMAYVLVNNFGLLDGFMYLKYENEEIADVYPPLPNRRHLKVGTFKFESVGTSRGERFIKKIFDHALASKVDDIYVTIYPKHEGLIKLFLEFGFVQVSTKTNLQNGAVEYVYVKEMAYPTANHDIISSYPFVRNTIQTRKFLLATMPQYHTSLFPDSILNTETQHVVQDISHTNSIKKIYICQMHGVTAFRPGDIIFIYRTSHGLSVPAEFSSVLTSMCVVREVKYLNNFTSADSYIKFCKKYSVFAESELRQFYINKRFPYIVSFTYNVALPRRLNRATLINNIGLDRNMRFSVVEINNQQFKAIVQASGINESIIVNQA